ncbi:Solute carrier family 13 member 3 [Oopsacas minuta]|uniref:Solute carrier family 13 member 3 n=1 Tax=Oopsacas minuta TaxID=111878 RepID=A0AAV7K033_9METZ|nr:Solute carrier family 13 member 3 [Oopsacas minuta]
MNKRSVLRYILTLTRIWWKSAVILLAPLVYSPLLIVSGSNPAKAAYGILIIGTYWVGDVAPLAATALLPVFIFPILNLADTNSISQKYFTENNLLYLGGLIIAVSVEKWNLHKRIAFSALLLFGSQPRRLLLGFMLVTGFLSMWISNTAVTAFMVPIAQAVLLSLKQEVKNSFLFDAKDTPVKFTVSGNSKDTEQISILTTSDVDEEESTDPGTELITNSEEKYHTTSYLRFCKALMLGIAYSANIGGTATLIGTGPNIVLSGYFNSNFPQAPPIDWGRWFIFSFPCAATALVFAWMYLSGIFCDDCLFTCRHVCCNKTMYRVESKRMREVVREHYKKLGPISYAQIMLILLMILLILLWLLRAPQLFPGWSSLFSDEEHPRGYLTNSSVAIFFAFLLFLLPAKLPWKQDGTTGTYERLLDWDTVQTKLPWGVVLLLGSGFAIAYVSQVSGLTNCIAVNLHGLGNLHPFLLSTSIIILTTFGTEVISNVSTITLLLPILHSLSLSIGVNPLYLMVPSTIATSYAFMFPVATPPNAIVYAYGHLRIVDMLLTGFGMNIVCMSILIIFTNTLGLPIFNLLSFPDYYNITSFNITNQTVC